MNEQNQILIPLKEMLDHTGAAKSSVLFFFKNNPDIAAKYLATKTITFKNGKKAKRYYVRYGFIAFYQQHLAEQECAEEDKELYHKIYYKYVEEQEKIFEQNGKSIASSKALWKDMEIIDANLSKLCFQYIREDLHREPSKRERLLIADMVYRHIFKNKTLYNIAIEVMGRELARIENGKAEQ